ncbi:hypothetical protein [Methylobrevis pamukkalensis]|uniref:Uncharacterized protein n=1 Tax=Methylobrevis pamukkalensis TaxID=1439726 RepID=A0A1E3GZW9_9HYPH|nr:hypothetical protein [Methylobrevis pamukkalensis]ODN69475.1 hypothetical protein A6302_03201 [Methylobrevis pamukkalensis]
MVEYIKQRVLPASFSWAIAGAAMVAVWAALVLALSLAALGLYAVSGNEVFIEMHRKADMIATMIGGAGAAILLIGKIGEDA